MTTDCEILRRENEKMAKELAEARESLQSFVYVVSHDLGAPLRAITGFSDILKKKYGSQFDEKGNSYLQLLFDGGVQAQTMMQGLLQFSRVYTETHEPKKMNLGEIVRRALGPFKEKIDAEEFVVTVEPLPDCVCDAVQIELLFSLLLRNAMTFKSPYHPLLMRIDARDEGDRWSIFVADNGIGVPPEASEKIFQIFKRAHSNHDYPGVGTGLAVAARIVERHQGNISVRPNATGGSIFTFTLHKEGPAAATTLAPKRSAHG